eukprot:SAG11_NODE_891_length_6685_cov_4.256909_3_plen_78_part_00
MTRDVVLAKCVVIESADAGHVSLLLEMQKALASAANLQADGNLLAECRRLALQLGWQLELGAASRPYIAACARLSST